MAVKSKAIKRKKKKLWFSVIAPDVFKNLELGETIAYTPSDLVGRNIQFSYSTITNNPRDKNKAFVLKIVRAAENKAYTEPVKILFSSGYISRLTRGSKTKFLFVGKYKTKSNALTIKGYVTAGVHIGAGVETQLRKQIDHTLSSKLSKIASEKVFEPNYMESLAKELKSALHKVYPVKGILFWKVLVE